MNIMYKMCFIATLVCMHGNFFKVSSIIKIIVRTNIIFERKTSGDCKTNIKYAVVVELLGQHSTLACKFGYKACVFIRF